MDEQGKTRTVTFDDLLADPLQQFDLRSELLASIVSYAAARPAAAATTAFTQTPDAARPEYLWLDLPAATTAA